jgi:hypothetical protein
MDMEIGTELTRRRFLQVAAAVMGGVTFGQAYPAVAFGSGSRIPVPGTAAGGLPILKAMIEEYARPEDDPWAVMHGIRAMGREFSFKGERAVDYLCNRFLTMKRVAGKDYLDMPTEYEGHSNPFLKTLLEAGVPLSHSFKVDGKRYTVGDLVASSKALFNFDPAAIDPDDIAWSLIAFSITTSPEKDGWTNAYGQQIRLRDVIRFGFDTLDKVTAGYRKAFKRGLTPEAVDDVNGFTCGGTHLVYGLASCVGNGHGGQEARQRLKAHLDLMIWRLESDSRLMDRFYQATSGSSGRSPGWQKISALYRNDAKIKFNGHVFEILSYVTHKGLFAPTSEQVRVVQGAGAVLTQAIQEIQGVDLFEVKQKNQKLYRLLIGDSCHAYHGINMTPGVNQV